MLRFGQPDRPSSTSERSTSRLCGTISRTRLAAFDFAEPSLVTGQRATTSVPSQSLYLMNSPFVINAADAAASRPIREVPDDGGGSDARTLAVLEPPADRR